MTSRNSLHWLEKIKHDDWWKSQMPITMKALSSAMGKDDSYIRRTLGMGFGTYEMETILSKLIPDIENRRLCFTETKAGRARKGTYKHPKFVWLEPSPVTIPRLGKAWSLWAECNSCHGNQFLPVLIDNKEHYACYHCLHPTQYKSIGAAAVNRSLIHEALKQTY